MIYLNGVKIGHEHFPNGEVNLLKIEEAIKTQNRTKHQHRIIMKYEDDRDLMVLYFIKKQIDFISLWEGNSSKENTILTISYLPYSRMDRRETHDAPFMLRYVCEFINSLNFKYVEVYEPHSDVTGKLLDRVIKRDIVLDLIPHVMNDIEFNIEDDYIVYADETSYKRYNSIEAKNKLIAKKKRDFDTGRILSLDIEGEIKHEKFNVLLVDDLCSRGGTFILNAQKLKELGADKIYLLVGHCENTIFDGEVFTSGLIDKVFTTDTILTKHNNFNNIQHSDKLKVYGIVNQLVGSDRL